MAKFLTLFLAVLIIGSQSHASKEGGNGGGAIVCTAGGTPGGDIISAEVLDLFEARAIRGLQSDLGDPKEDYSLKIERVLKALERVSPIRAKKYRDLYKTFF